MLQPSPSAGVSPAKGRSDDAAACLSLHCMRPCTTVQDQVWAGFGASSLFYLDWDRFPSSGLFKIFPCFLSKY